MSDDQPRIRVEHPIPGVARLVLARPKKRNAQDPTMLYELDDALMGAATDIKIRVIILAADGPDFSAGHDLESGFGMPGPPSQPWRADSLPVARRASSLSNRRPI
jgi:enoyl-CoA hydratase